MAKFVVLQGPDKGRTLVASEERVLIGRGQADFPLNDQTISRRHAELRRVSGRWFLVDLGSANGTFVNGVRLEAPVPLRRGDQIRLGGSLLIYTGGEPVEQLSGGQIPSDMVTVDAGADTVDAAIMARLPSNEDSVVLAAAETANAVKAWKVIRELTDVTGSLLPVDRLLSRVMDILFDEVPVDRGAILLKPEQEDELRPEVVRFRQRAELFGPCEQNIIVSHSVIQHVVRERDAVLCANIVADRRFGRGKSAQNLGMRSVICAPIISRERVLGVIHLDCPVTEHTYSEYELKLITAIAHQAGLAIENARLVQSHMQRERLAAAGEAVAYLSHYIKNILQGMRSGADVLERGLQAGDLERTAQGWRIVERNLDRTYNLVMNMLAFGKSREPHFEVLQLNRIVEDVLQLVHKQAEAEQVTLQAELEEHLPPLPVDRDGIHQVLLNLITNAIEAVERGRGHVRVRTWYDGTQAEVIVAVIDNGPGVPPQERKRIFDAFHSTKGQGGTGLGLAAARKIVQEMHGRIELIGPPEGGAEFRVHLPTSQPKGPSLEDTQAHVP